MLSHEQRKRLDGLGLQVYDEYHAIVCKLCGFALQANSDHVLRHLGEKHVVTRDARAGLNRLVHDLALPKPSTLTPQPDNQPRLQHLATHKGISCKLCSFKSISTGMVSRLVPKAHPGVVRAGRRGDCDTHKR